MRVCIIYCSSRESGIEQKTWQKKKNTNKRKTTFFFQLNFKTLWFQILFKKEIQVSYAGGSNIKMFVNIFFYFFFKNVILHFLHPFCFGKAKPWIQIGMQHKK